MELSCTPEELTILQRAAERESLPLAVAVRRAAIAWARKLLGLTALLFTGCVAIDNRTLTSANPECLDYAQAVEDKMHTCLFSMEDTMAAYDRTAKWCAHTVANPLSNPQDCYTELDALTCEEMASYQICKVWL